MMKELEFKNKMMSIIRKDVNVGHPLISYGKITVTKGGYSGNSYNFGYGKELFNAHSIDKNLSMYKKLLKKRITWCYGKKEKWKVNGREKDWMKNIIKAY